MVVILISVASVSSLAQDSKYSAIPGSAITAPKNSSGTLASNIDLGDIDHLSNDSFPTENSLRAAKNLQPDSGVNTRSVQDAALFKNIAPSVVLIVTKDALGSGTIIGNKGEILTNWHVVGGYSEVGVILKPASNTQKISSSDIRRAQVIKIDQVSDLALLKLVEAPSDRQPVKLGDDSDINIGADVHAIGHPNGEAWTYTKGIISQYRNDFPWTDGPKSIKHVADVIQTQTPINPGNSGGPLLTDNGRLVGVNSFKEMKSEGLNFAVSVDDVKTFLASNRSRIAPSSAQTSPPAQADKAKCEMKETYKGKTSNGKGDIVIWDSKCSGKADLSVTTPYNKSEPMIMEMDRNGDGKIDVAVFSDKRNYKWDISFWDDNYDGKWELVGFHKNGELKPYKYQDFDAFKAQTASK